ncbi:MAG: hypothetical protein M0042_00350 [Nitrospiraceae bacterium]|nr:hypothetical protein [Nitrospiraceae bacterium]
MKFRNIRISIIAVISSITLIAIVALAADDAATYLIMGDIPPYYRLTITRDIITDKVKTIPGYNIYRNAGILMGVSHFYLDHTDITYKTDYQNSEIGMGMEVQVTQHSGSDSDKWLAHELDIEFRNYYGIPGHYVKKINGNIVYVFGAAGRTYRWLSGNKIIEIEYHDAMLTKPEPIEVIQAYLTKHPSTLPDTIISKGDNISVWIKDEMDRRLWLCDRWFSQLALGKTDVRTALGNVKESLEIFLDYRAKYFALAAEADEDKLIGYLNQNDERSIRSKLAEYKTWWSANKGASISVP